MAFDLAILGLVRRITTVVFALFVGLSLSFAGTLSDPENEGEKIEEIKVADALTRHRLRESRTAQSKVVVHNHHVYSNGDHLALPHRPLPDGHYLVNGLRAPLRC